MNPRDGRRVRCLVCDRSVTKNNLRAHYATNHGGKRAHVPLVDLFDELPGTEVAPVRGVEAPPSAPPVAAELPPLGPEDLDGIVLAVVESLAVPSGLLPVAHLAAVFEWRDATAAFLRSVRGSEVPGEGSRRP